ncbi:MarR family winged helix-turn-helix transcriptional regulator [Granulicella paludicola]|jgi:DNA-binding MarR family transcriptional regulator|uniref:MarR family winged helix-turn-helix transcriptional regulator n=1 Tax=Granulicella paludicola TaxID=474951 RepID=UPI0021DF5C88|nr:MarR family winged helix-turn-helix transcriptional regulator [Granulicella paludicola]
MTTENTVPAKDQRLKSLAEFRYQMRKFLSFSETAAERCGIATQQYQLMQVIAAMAPGQDASISYLADRMVLKHNSMVELVDRAERAGLVKREHDERDLRRSLVRLTVEGQTVLGKLVDEHMDELAPKCEPLIEALKQLQDITRTGMQGLTEGEGSV